MKVSKKTRYGLRLMVELARNYHTGPVSLSEVARKEGISERFLGQIIHQLKTQAPVVSIRGPKGGYMLSISPSEITIKSVLDIFGVPLAFVECINDISACDKGEDCPSRIVWVEIAKCIDMTLRSLTLAHLISNKGKSKSNILNIKGGDTSREKALR